MQKRRSTRLLRKETISRDGDGDVPPPEPDEPHIAARAQDLGGGALTTTSTPPSLSSISTQNADSTLAKGRGRVKFVGLLEPGAEKAVASPDFVKEGDPVTSKGGGEGEENRKTQNSKAIGNRELQSLEVWCINETAGSRSTRAARGRIASPVREGQGEIHTSQAGSDSAGSRLRSIPRVKNIQGEGTGSGSVRIESTRKPSVRRRGASRSKIVPEDNSGRLQQIHKSEYGKSSEQKPQEDPVAVSARIGGAQAEEKSLVFKDNDRVDSLTISDSGEDKFRETLKRIYSHGVAAFAASQVAAAEKTQQSIDVPRKHSREEDEIHAAKKGHKGYLQACVDQESQAVQRGDNKSIRRRRATSRRALSLAPLKLEIGKDVSTPNTLILQDNDGESAKKGVVKSIGLLAKVRSPKALPKNTICISSFLTDEEVKELMPEVDETVLTRAKKRAEGPRGERLMSRRASSTQAELVGVRRNSVINGVKAVNILRTPALNNSALNGEAKLPTQRTPTNPGSQKQTANTSSRAKRLESEDAPPRRKEEKPLERNIDNVVFGDVSFKAWYPSWYPKEVIGEKGLAGEAKGIVVSDLYVCNKCFAYSKSAVDWVRHTRCCDKEVPGEKIYTHGSHGVWSIWEVDGDVDTLFCQNLSLFAKLFLDNKSVFFDVSGFKYFMLVHTLHIAPPMGADPLTPPTFENRVVGFFSKEKMSWDNNNLACILIFPPWQKKSLGSLLMGVSYAISRRERVLGGPEKPISELGRKGYKRFWGAEIARWLLEQTETDKKGGDVVTVADVSQGTWIVADDSLSVLREMGVVEKAAGDDEESVRIDKAKVREWVTKMKMSLDRVVDEDGFVEGYAIAPETSEEEEEEELNEDIEMQE